MAAAASSILNPEKCQTSNWRVSPELLARLSDTDRMVLDKLLQEPPEYVDHPWFKQRGIERKLFGGPALFASETSTHFIAPGSVIKNDCLDGSVPTLTAAQEQLLFKRLNFARRQVAIILEKRHGQRLNAPTVRTLLGWEHRALYTRGELVRFNMPLVLAMAKRSRLASVDYNELISEGNMALLRSVEKFDCSRGFKFSTYCCRAILKSFSRVAMRTGRYRGLFGVEYDPALEKSDFLERKRASVEDACVDELRVILAANAADLNDVEQIVIRARFALEAVAVDTPRPKTLQEVGRLIGVTKERVRQIQNRALQKIRLALEERVLAA